MPISPQERAMLVELARQAVAAEVRGEAAPALPQLTGVLAERRGCFVTLTNHGRLRGCIGQFTPQTPLAETVLEMAVAAANDPRFTYNRITPEELPNLSVEVSVLSPLTQTRDPLSLKVGVHGIYVIHGGRAGCFLPEVATDQGWDAKTFLDECCLGKAGLPQDAWASPDAQVYLFTSEKFGT